MKHESLAYSVTFEGKCSFTFFVAKKLQGEPAYSEVFGTDLVDCISEDLNNSPELESIFKLESKLLQEIGDA
jgi:hypothetical protein